MVKKRLNKEFSNRLRAIGIFFALLNRVVTFLGLDHNVGHLVVKF